MERKWGVMSSDSFSPFSIFFGAVNMVHNEKNPSTNKRKRAALSNHTPVKYEISTCLCAVASAFQGGSELSLFSPSDIPHQRADLTMSHSG